jgi:type IV pilus assembly protein PilA
MKTNKNVKGFTLVELIVVIAIIGVLAAILVPSMLGYVKKSNIAAANSNAKTLYNAVVSALTDLDAAGHPVTGASSNNWYSMKGGAAADAATIGGSTEVRDCVKKYFDSVDQLAVANAKIDAKGVCIASCVQKGNYIGTYPDACQDGTQLPSTSSDIDYTGGSSSSADAK